MLGGGGVVTTPWLASELMLQACESPYLLSVKGEEGLGKGKKGGSRGKGCDYGLLELLQILHAHFSCDDRPSLFSCSAQPALCSPPPSPRPPGLQRPPDQPPRLLKRRTSPEGRAEEEEGA